MPASRRLSPQRRRLFWTLLLLFDAAVVAGIGWAYLQYRLPDGVELNRLAWESSYRERGLPVPAAGPREGYWGEKLAPHHYDTQFGPLVFNFSEPGRFAYDELGRQRRPHPDPAARRLLILGGSVANGAYASAIDRTWWAQLADLAAAAGTPLDLTVWGAGGWSSNHEVPAMAWLLERESFDAVLLVHGLNDLTERRELPLGQRLADYLANLQQAAAIARTRDLPLFVAPQPYLPAKRHLTRLEKRVLQLHRFDDAHRLAFAGLLVGLRELEAAGALHLIDCTDVLSDETATTFSDLWHFSDPGHTLLAQKLAAALVPALAPPAP